MNLSSLTDEELLRLRDTVSNPYAAELLKRLSSALDYIRELEFDVDAANALVLGL